MSECKPMAGRVKGFCRCGQPISDGVAHCSQSCADTDPRRGFRASMQMSKAHREIRRVEPKLAPATFDGMYGYKDRNND